MKYKTIYGLHEARMWIGTIIAGVAATAAIVEAHPEIKDGVKRKFNAIKDGIKRKLNKKPKLKIVVVDENGDPV